MRTHTENSLSHTPTSNVRYIALKCDLHVTQVIIQVVFFANNSQLSFRPKVRLERQKPR